NLNPVAFDHGVREQFVGHLGGEGPGLGDLRRRKIQLEIFPLPYVVDARVPERMERLGNRPALRIEHRRLQRDEYSRAHAASFPTDRRSTRSPPRSGSRLCELRSAV